MTQIVTPSKKMTNEQIDKAVEQIAAKYRKELRDHQGELEAGAVQRVLGQKDFGPALFAEFRTRVEVISEMIVRRVKVNRSLTPQQALDATGRKQYTDKKAVDSMPVGEWEEVEMCFFPIKKRSSDAEVAQALAFRGLTPDPRAQAQVNAEDPAFADTHPNGISWQDADGNWNFVTFSRWDDGERRVRVRRDGRDWVDRWWVGGSRECQPLEA